MATCTCNLCRGERDSIPERDSQYATRFRYVNDDVDVIDDCGDGDDDDDQDISR